MATLAIELPARIARAAREAGLLLPRTLAQLFEAPRRSRQIKTDNARRLQIMIPGSRINSEPSMPGRGVTR